MVTEYIEGRTLAQWMRDNPAPDLETVRGIVDRSPAACSAFHRMEMLHQDLRPDNIMIDGSGTVKIIDSAPPGWPGWPKHSPRMPARHPRHRPVHRARSISSANSARRARICSRRRDRHQMICGRLPYGAEVAKSRPAPRSRRSCDTRRCSTSSAKSAWVDAALARAGSIPDPPDAMRNFRVHHDLRHPNLALMGQRAGAPGATRFYSGRVSLLLAVLVMVLLGANTLRT